jgi:hypothetical protein
MQSIVHGCTGYVVVFMHISGYRWKFLYRIVTICILSSPEACFRCPHEWDVGNHSDEFKLFFKSLTYNKRDNEPKLEFTNPGNLCKKTSSAKSL